MLFGWICRVERIKPLWTSIMNFKCAFGLGSNLSHQYPLERPTADRGVFWQERPCQGCEVRHCVPPRQSFLNPTDFAKSGRKQLFERFEGGNRIEGVLYRRHPHVGGRIGSAENWHARRTRHQNKREQWGWHHLKQLGSNHDLEGDPRKTSCVWWTYHGHVPHKMNQFVPIVPPFFPFFALFFRVDRGEYLLANAVHRFWQRQQ